MFNIGLTHFRTLDVLLPWLLAPCGTEVYVDSNYHSVFESIWVKDDAPWANLPFLVFWPADYDFITVLRTDVDSAGKLSGQKVTTQSHRLRKRFHIFVDFHTVCSFVMNFQSKPPVPSNHFMEACFVTMLRARRGICGYFNFSSELKLQSMNARFHYKALWAPLPLWCHLRELRAPGAVREHPPTFVTLLRRARC